MIGKQNINITTANYLFKIKTETISTIKIK